MQSITLRLPRHTVRITRTFDGLLLLENPAYPGRVVDVTAFDRPTRRALLLRALERAGMVL